MNGHAARIETLPEFQALVLRLDEPQLGSLMLASGCELADFFHSLPSYLPGEPSYLPGEYVIVDLSRVRYYGAAFLALLVDLQRDLKAVGRELVVTGDQLGLIRFSRLPVRSFDSMGAALEVISQQDSLLAAAV